MSVLDLAAANLLSPIVLCFVLGAIATLVHSDLKVPDQVAAALSLYLLLAIGLKGGAELARASLAQVALPALAALALGTTIPLWTWWIARRAGYSVENAAALAAHYGSVSAVTFIAGQAWLEAAGTRPEGFMAALLAIMEVPAIVIALALAARVGAMGPDSRGALREVFTGRSILLLAGGITIGLIAGPERMTRVEPFFSLMFPGALCLFLLDLGQLAMRRLREGGLPGPSLLAIGTILPLAHGTLGVVVGALSGLGQGGATLLGILAASASYIAAPAAIRLALPKADPALYLTGALAVTFPFNLVVGLPIYGAVAAWWFGT